MTTTTPERTESDRYRERFPDWRPSDARVCPRSVACKRCLAHYGRAAGRGAERRPCVCESRHVRRALDHGRIWLTPDGERVLTGEPYGIDGQTLCRFVADCHTLGLRVDVDPDSPWNPGWTVLLIVRRQEAA